MNGDIIEVPFVLAAIGVTLGGMNGTLHAARKRMDILGAILVGIAAALGSPTIRDLTLGTAPQWLASGMINFALLGGLAGFALGRVVRYLNPVVSVLDAVMIGVWVVFSCELALASGQNALSAIMIGTISAVGGGLIRDVLCRDVPTAFSPTQFDAATALLASVVFVGVSVIFPQVAVAEVATIVSASALRAAARHYGWRTVSAVELSERLRGRQSIYDPATGTLERFTS